jgi:hypothetical protein
MNKRVLPFLLILLVLAVAVPVLAQLSANYDAGWHVLSGGGSSRNSQHFQIDDVLGQWPDGRSTGAIYQVDPGFWHSGRVPDGKRTYLPLISKP